MKILLALAALPLLLTGCGDPESPSHTTPESPPTSTPEVIDTIHQNTTTFDNDRVLREYMRAVCKKAPLFAEVPPTPPGVSEKDAGYVAGLLIATETC